MGRNPCPQQSHPLSSEGLLFRHISDSVCGHRDQGVGAPARGSEGSCSVAGSSAGSGSHTGACPAGNSRSGLAAPEPEAEAAGNQPFLPGLPALGHPREGRALSHKALGLGSQQTRSCPWGPLPLSFLSSSWTQWWTVSGSNPSSRSSLLRPEEKPCVIPQPDFLTSETRIMAVRIS